MSRRVILLRHAAPHVRRDQQPSQWPLSAAGRSAAVAIGGCLPREPAFASSPEVKAVQTLVAAACVDPAAIQVDARFGEVARLGEPFDDDYKSRRLAWVAGRLDERHSTWEQPDEAAVRFQAGLDAVEGGIVVVASHGMVIASWLRSVGYVGPGEDAGRLWTNLRFPDLLDLQVD